MTVRLSEWLHRTQRDDPSEADLPGYRLLHRGGYLRRTAPGEYAWLPLGHRLVTRFEALLRKESAELGASELRLATAGEPEVFAQLAREMIASHRDLPRTLQQFQDAPAQSWRQGAGPLYGRRQRIHEQFTYTHDRAQLQEARDSIRAMYLRIFRTLGLTAHAVPAALDADGAAPEELLIVPFAAGRETYLESAGGYRAAPAAYRTPVPTAPPAVGLEQPLVFATPGAETISSLVELSNAVLPRTDGRAWRAADALKHVILALDTGSGERELVIVGLPGDREVDQERAHSAFGVPVQPASPEDLRRHPELIPGYLGPVQGGKQLLGTAGSSGIRYLLDPRVTDGSVWLSGANVPGEHVANLVKGRDFTADGTIDIAEVRAGDPAPDGSGPLRLVRGVSLGSLMLQGEVPGLALPGSDGRRSPVLLVSARVAITRLLALLAELKHDDSGLLWPPAVAPFDVQLLLLGRDTATGDAATELAASLSGRGLDVLLDDRPKVSPGVKFTDAELLGIPYLIVVGRAAADGRVELRERSSGRRIELDIAGLARSPQWPPVSLNE